MKWTKSIIGEIGVVDTKNKLCYREAIKKIPDDVKENGIFATEQKNITARLG